jgi:hypothetical protein
MNLNEVDPELRARIRGTESPEEVLEIAREMGVELSNEQLEEVTGGINWDGAGEILSCPYCHSTKIRRSTPGYVCDKCGKRFSKPA